MQNDHGITDGRLLADTGDHIELELEVSSGSDYFDGHFPQFKLLPAVGQFEAVTRAARTHFKLKNEITRIRRIKFSSPILPDSRVFLSMTLDRNKGSVAFELADAADHSKIHSSGSFSVNLDDKGGQGETP